MNEENKIKKHIGTLIREQRKLKTEKKEYENEIRILKNFIKDEKPFLPIIGIGFVILTSTLTTHGLILKIALFISASLISSGVSLYYNTTKNNTSIKKNIDILNEKIECIDERINEIDRDCWYSWEIINSGKDKSILKQMNDNENFKKTFLKNTLS